MAQFEPAIEITLQHEGGFVDNPADKGKATKYGITQADMPDKDIAEISISDAESWYQKNRWQSWMESITSQDVANKIFDMAILLGTDTAVRLLQRAIGLIQDGKFGPLTLAAVNNMYPALLLAKYKSALLNHFMWIVQQDPTQKVFLEGWETRINS